MPARIARNEVVGRRINCVCDFLSRHLYRSCIHLFEPLPRGAALFLIFVALQLRAPGASDHTLAASIPNFLRSGAVIARTILRSPSPLLRNSGPPFLAIASAILRPQL